MKTPLLILLFALSLSALAQPTVITSIHPLYDLTWQLAGDNANVIRLLPPGTSPHTFDPSPQDVARIAQADLIVMNGGYGVDDWLLELIAASGTRAPTLNLFETLDFDPLESDAHEHEEEARDDDHDGERHDDEPHDDEPHDDAPHNDEHDHGPVNSHLWLDPVLMIQAVSVIAEALASIDPENAAAYEQNAATLQADLEALHEELQETLAPIAGAAFVPFHDAWPYFARRYGLKLIVEIEPFPGREPSPAYLRYALGLIAESGARAIFTEPQLSRRPAEVVAESAGVPLYTIDPIGGTPETERYQDLMRESARTLIGALGQ